MKEVQSLECSHFKEMLLEGLKKENMIIREADIPKIIEKIMKEVDVES